MPFSQDFTLFTLQQLWPRGAVYGFGKNLLECLGAIVGVGL